MNPDTSLSTQIFWFVLLFLFSSPLAAFLSFQFYKRAKPVQMRALRLIRGPVIGLFSVLFVMMMVLTPTYDIFAMDDDAGRLIFWGGLSVLAMIAGFIGYRMTERR